MKPTRSTNSLPRPRKSDNPNDFSLAVTGKNLERCLISGYLQDRDRKDSLTGLKKLEIMNDLLAGSSVEDACKKYGVHKSHFYFHVAVDERLRRDLDAIRKGQAREAEGVLANRALDPKATLDRIFFLKSWIPERYNPSQKTENKINISFDQGAILQARERMKTINAEIVSDGEQRQITLQSDGERTENS